MKAFELVAGTAVVLAAAFDKWFWSERGRAFMWGLNMGLALFAAFVWGCCL
mgnify:FL=1